MNRVRVGINLLWLLPEMAAGAEEYAVRVLGALGNEAAEELEVTILCNRRFPAAHPDLADRFPTAVAPVGGGARVVRIAAESTWLPREAARRGLHVIHHMNNVVPWVRNRPSVLTVHDLRPMAMPETLGWAHGAYLRSRLGPSVRAAAAVTTPSSFVRQTVVDMLGADPRRVLEVSAPLPPLSSEPAASGINLPFFLYPASTSPHKNHGVLLRAFASVAAALSDPLVVLTGVAGPAEEAIAAVVSRLGLHDRVRRLGRVPADLLHGLMRDAVALVFPSRYEGFGLPVVEAMAVGCPVIAADTTALPEVVGGAGVLVGPDDVQGWTRAMLDVLEDPAYRERVAAAGRERVKAFTPAETARRSVVTYRLVARGG